MVRPITEQNLSRGKIQDGGNKIKTKFATPASSGCVQFAQGNKELQPEIAKSKSNEEINYF